MVAFFSKFGNNSWPWSRSLIRLYPSLHTFEILKNRSSIDYQITNHWKFCHRFQCDDRTNLVHKRTASLPNAVVDDHRARPAHLFKATLLPSNWRGSAAVKSLGIFLNFLETSNHIHIRTIFEMKLLPIRLRLRPLLTFDFNNDCVKFLHRNYQFQTTTSLRGVPKERRSNLRT